jgi:RNase P/RNase MRP subunit POP5
MQICKKFKQCVESDLDVNNELTSSMMEDVALIEIEALVTNPCATNQIFGSCELASANERVIKCYHSKRTLINKCSYNGGIRVISI